MLVEVLVLNEKGCSFGIDIFKLISNKVSCLYVSEKVIKKIGVNPKIVIIESESFKKIDTKRYIVVFGKSKGYFNKKLLNNAHSVIVDDRSCIKSKNINTQILVCGMSMDDTITVSSNTLENATVSINKSIKGLFSKIEQEEISLPKNKNNYELMAAGAILMLSGYDIS